MAGTRLLVSVSFLLSFLTLICTALFVGLFWQSDVLTVPLFQQGGRSVLRKRGSLLDSLEGSGAFPVRPLRIVTADSQAAAFWKSQLMSGGRNNIAVVRGADIAADPDFKAFCEDPTAESVAAAADMWICEFWIPRERARLVFAGNSSTAVFYPRSISERVRDLKRIYPAEATLKKKSRESLHLAILLDQGVRNFNRYINMVHRALAKQQGADYGPCYSRGSSPTVSFRFVDIASRASLVQEGNNTSFHLPVSDITSSFLFGERVADDTFLYFPPTGRQPLLLVNDKGETSLEASLLGDALLSIVPNDSDDDDEAKVTALVEIALNRLLDRRIAQCLGMPTDMMEGVDVEFTQDDVPRSNLAFYVPLWYQRNLPVWNERAAALAVRNYRTLMQSSRFVAIPKSVADRWLRAVHLIDAARENAVAGSFEAAMECLEESIQILEALQSDATLSEPLDFPFDQYAAIFAPILLPLLLPALSNLVREYKRYRELVRQKKVAA
jgi:hypothetical protein